MVRDHETDPDAVYLYVGTDAVPGAETIVDRDLLPQLLASPFSRWGAFRADGGGPNSAFYVGCHLDGRRGPRLRLHRAVLGLRLDDRRVVSHLNHNPLDNRRANLEATTAGGNARHGVRGVRPRGCSWALCHNAWRCRIRVASRSVHLGYFENEADANAEYNAAAAVLDDLHSPARGLTPALIFAAFAAYRAARVRRGAR